MDALTKKIEDAKRRIGTSSLSEKIAIAKESLRQQELAKQSTISENYNRAIAEGTLSKAASPSYTLSQRATQADSEALNRLLTSKKIQTNTLQDEASREANRAQINNIALEKSLAEYKEKYLGKKNDASFLGRFSSNYDIGRLSQDEASAWNKALTRPTGTNRKLAEGISSVKEEYAAENMIPLGGDGLVSSSLAGYLPQLGDQLKAQAVGAAAGAAVGSVVPVFGTAAGAKAGIVAATGLQSYNQMRGAAYKSLLDAGAPEETAQKAAGDEALVSSIIEMADTGIDIATLGIGTLVNNLAKGGAKATAKAIAKEGAEEAAESALKKFAKAIGAYGVNVASEGAQESAQQLISIANANRLRQETGALNLTKATIRQAGNLTDAEKGEIAESGIEGMKIAAMMGGATKAGTALANTKLSDREAGIKSLAERRQIQPAAEESGAKPTVEPRKNVPLLPSPKMYVSPSGEVAENLDLFAKKSTGLSHNTPQKEYSIAYNPVKSMAYAEYDEAIGEIQNYFGTNELRADEFSSIKDRLGIDIEAIVKSVHDAEALDEMTDRERFDYLDSIGVADFFYGQETANQFRKKEPYGPKEETGKTSTFPEYKVYNGRQIMQNTTLQGVPGPAVDEEGVNTTTVVKPVATTPRTAQTADPLMRSLENYRTGLNQEQQRKYENLRKTFGIQEPGENPARSIEVPAQTAADRFVSHGAQTMMEAGVTPPEVVSEFERLILDGKMDHQIIHDKNAKTNAENTIKNLGWSEAMAKWKAKANGNGKVSKYDIALGQTLYNQAVNAKNIPVAMELAQELVAEATRAGQNLQAQRLLKTMTPDGQLYGLERVASRMNSEIAQKHKNKYPEVKIDESLVADLLNSTDEESTTAAVDKIKQNIADQLPVTMLDRWNKWRYLSMLGNPRTHIRNMAGNVAMQGLVKVKNMVGAAVEATAESMGFLGEQQRTKTLIKDRAAVDFAREDYRGMQEVLSGNKYDDRTDILSLRKVLPGILDKLANKNTELLSAEDVLFKKGTYIDSFAQAMSARGLTKETLTNGSAESKRQLSEIREYAMTEALKATFQDSSKLASTLNQLSQGNPYANILIEGAIPFKKTPINIVKRGLEYSPAGLMKAITTDAYKLSKGEISGTQLIDNLSAGITGSGAVALGAYLVSQGLLTSGSDDEAEDRLETLQGAQEYALQIGDYTYTVDWMAPAILPVLVGAEAYSMTQEKGMDYGKWIEAFSKVADPVFELTMMDGLNNLIKTAAYGGDGAEIGTAAVESALNYVSQGVPTLAGQIARTVDDTRRYSTYVDKNSQIPASLQKFAGRNMAKIPGLNQTLPASIDQWGREDKTNDLALRAFENLLSPGYLSKQRTTKADEEIGRLFQSLGDSSVIPSYPAKYFNVDGERVSLTGKEYEQFSKARGQTSLESVMSFLGNKEYDALSDTEKAAAISDAYSYSTAKAKTKVSDYTLQDWHEKAAEAEKQGIPITTFIIARNKTKDIHSGDETSPQKKKQIDSIPGLNQKQRETLYESFKVAKSLWQPKAKAQNKTFNKAFNKTSKNKSFSSAFKW